MQHLQKHKHLDYREHNLKSVGREQVVPNLNVEDRSLDSVEE